MAALDGMKEWVSSLVIVVILVAALALALSDFRDDMGDQCSIVEGTQLVYNTTSNQCYNGSDVGQAEYTTAHTAHFNVTTEGLEGTANASDYFSTIGTLIGVAAIIAVVMIAFYFVRR